MDCTGGGLTQEPAILQYPQHHMTDTILMIARNTYTLLPNREVHEPQFICTVTIH